MVKRVWLTAPLLCGVAAQPGGSTAGCSNPTCASPPCAAALLGDVGCTIKEGHTNYAHELLEKGDTIATGSHIYGPFEAGFTSAQDSFISAWGCSDPSVVYDTAGGKDITTAELETAYKCNMEFPRIEGDTYIGVVGECGGHTPDYHFHKRLICLYEETGSHSASVGEIAGYLMYGKWENFDEQLLPYLDACGGHIGPTPDCEDCYHYHVQDKRPFTVGCHGPSASGGLVSLATCRSLYSECGDGTESIEVGAGVSIEYDRYCPCFDADESNVGTKELPALSTTEISYVSNSTTNSSTAEADSSTAEAAGTPTVAPDFSAAPCLFAPVVGLSAMALALLVN